VVPLALADVLVLHEHQRLAHERVALTGGHGDVGQHQAGGHAVEVADRLHEPEAGRFLGRGERLDEGRRLRVAVGHDGVLGVEVGALVLVDGVEVLDHRLVVVPVRVERVLQVAGAVHVGGGRAREAHERLRHAGAGHPGDRLPPGLFGLGQGVGAGQERAAVEEGVGVAGRQAGDLRTHFAGAGRVPLDLDDLDVGALDRLTEALLVVAAEVVVLDEHRHRGVGLLLLEQLGEHVALERVGGQRRPDQPGVVGVAPRRRTGGGEDVGHAQLVQLVADGDVVRRTDHAEHRERLVAVGADQLGDVLDGLGGVVLVVLVFVLDGDRLAGEVGTALLVDLVEVGLPPAGDLGERRGQPGLRVARRERDGVTDLLGRVGDAVLGVDRRLLRATLAVGLGGGVAAVVVVIARAAGRSQQRQRHERGEHLGRGSLEHVPS
jgi:hypothetical protein